VEDHLRSEQSITAELKEMCCGVDWISLDENRVQIVAAIYFRIVY
jgi:hypothetical protein